MLSKESKDTGLCVSCHFLGRVSYLVDHVGQDELFCFGLRHETLSHDVERHLPNEVEVILNTLGKQRLLQEVTSVQLPDAVLHVSPEDHFVTWLLGLGDLWVLLERPQLGIIL